MSGCSTSVNVEVQDPHQESALTCANSSEFAASSLLYHENNEEENKQDNIGNLNVDEEEDEVEDVDFNPFLRESHSVEEASSSHSSEVEDLDTDADDNARNPSLVFVKNLNGRNFHVMKDSNAIGEIEHGEEIVMQTAVSSGECMRNSDTSDATITERGSVSTTQCGNGLLSDKERGPSSPTYICRANSRKATVDMDIDGAISMRTRARYSLASFSLDELETFLQETDDEDELQNVDDEEEYKKFLAAVLQGDDSPNLQGNTNVDDEDENDADFELELEEALESDHGEIEERRMTRRNKRQKAAFERNKKHSEQSNRPLRPLLPFVPVGSCPSFEDNQLLPSYAQSYKPPVNNGLIGGFTPHQIGQLHCLIHEHVQLLIQVFSVCVLDPARGNIASEVKKLIVEILQKRDQVLQWRTFPYPRFCFFPPYIHPSVPGELHKRFPLHDSNENVQPDISSGSDTELLCGGDKSQQEEPAGSFGTLESTSWVPYICGPMLSITDVAPLRLVGSYISGITSAVRAYKQYQIEVGVETQFEKEPLFSLHHDSFSAKHDGPGEKETCFQDSSDVLASSTKTQSSKKTMAANLIEKSKKQSVALVPKEIAKLARRFLQFFNPAFYPRKPPPAPLVNRVLFTDTEDELLAMGLMEYNTDWKAIQQRFLPCKSSHQIFVRQKNRASSKAPENPIKAVRRIKNSPLTSEEIARIEMGFKRFKLDWISICRLFVPYRDPSLLPRQWRIATGTQKSYKADAAKNAKRRSCDLRRKVNKPSGSTRHSSSEKEDEYTDNAIEETYSGNHGMYKEDEAYVHEAFLADWRSDSNVSLGFPNLSAQGGSQASGQKYNFGSGNFQLQRCTNTSSSSMLSNQVVLRPYRARKSIYTRLVKLAPDLPPVNLPPSVRVMSQSDYKRSLGEASTMNCVKQENGAPQVGSTINSQINNSVKSGQFKTNSLEVSAGNQHNKCNEVLISTCAAEERSESDLQMHPLLFQASQDGSLPYYPLNCTTTSFPFFTDKQPQLNLSLFHNPRQIKDAVNFLCKSSEPPEKHSSPSDVDFHPLLHDGMDLQSTNPAARIPAGAESRQMGAPSKSPLCPSVSKPSRDGSSCVCVSKVTSLGGKGNEVDLNSHMSSISENLETVASRYMRLDRTRRLASCPGPKESALDGSGNKPDSGDLPLAASKNRGSKRLAENLHVESLPEIVMEQEELSDSDEEFGENVEFEHEEMADSEGEETSDSEQLLDIPDEEIQLDEMDEDNDNPQMINRQDDRGGNTCSTSGGHSEGSGSANKGVNNSLGALSFNLNSHPPVSPLSPIPDVGKYDFGPFESDSLTRNQISACPNMISSLNTNADDNDENVDKDAGG